MSDVDVGPAVSKAANVFILDLDAFAQCVAAHVLSRLGELSANRADSPWLNIDGAAEYLACSVERLRKLVARAEVPYHQATRGSRIFFNKHELDRWLLSL